MLKLLGSLCVAAGGALAWALQRRDRRRKRDTLSDLRRAFRRMGEEIRMARTPLPALLKTLAEGCGPEAAAFFAAAAQAAAGGEGLVPAWRRQAEALCLDPGDQSSIAALGEELKGDEERACKAISHVINTLDASARAAAEKRPEEEKRAAALWFSASALLVILLI